jgi:nuclear transport factor 2 (NTF2) superfamily protein
MIIDKGIYKLIKWGVIHMKESKLIFGTALLIDAFMTGQDETTARKIAYYLEDPEKVLYRLRQIRKKDTTSLTRNFSNEASYKLLKELLCEIYEKNGYGDFKEKIKMDENGQESMRLSLDDILKTYLYIRDYIWENSEKIVDDRTIRKKYSDFMSRVKYALVARRPELLEGA